MSPMVQVMPAISTVGTRYWVIFAKRLAFRSPTFSAMIDDSPAGDWSCWTIGTDCSTAPIACSECHSGAVPTSLTHSNGTVQFAFGTLASGLVTLALLFDRQS